MTHPVIRELFSGMARQPAFQEAVRALANTREAAPRQSLSGLTTTAKALYTVLLWQAVERPVVVIVDGNKQAETLYEAIETFFELLASGLGIPHPQLLPALDVLPGQHLSPHAEIAEQRARALWRLATERVPITVTPVASALLRNEPASFYRQLALTLRTGEEIGLEDVVSHLESIGYERREPVELPGDFSVRGGILDVFPPGAGKPYRLEFFGDQIESMRRFEPDTQRSISKAQEASFLPLVEYPKSHALFTELSAAAGAERIPATGEPFAGWELLVPLVRPREASLFSLMQRPLVVWDEPEQLRGASERLWKRLDDPERDPICPPERIFFRWDDLESAAAPHTWLTLRELDVIADLSTPASLHISTRPAMTFQGNMQVAASETRSLVEQGHRVVFFAATNGELERLAEILQEYSIPFQLGLEPSDSTPSYLAQRAYLAGSVASTCLVRGLIRRGVLFPEDRLAVFGSEDLFGASEWLGQKPLQKGGLSAFAADMADLKPGDYVVHQQHGVGRFLGLREVGTGEQTGDYMLLEYAGDARLYVPLTRLDLVQKFRGAGDQVPALDRLGGATWERTKKRVKARMRDMADELLKLYAERKLAQGFAFSPDANWQREFEDSFEFTETADQLSAIRDIKHDMEQGQPMDRLLCGDVGFGKTEVAMRAAFKALGDGKQVAVLAPTTVLCFQHFETFKRRFAPFPVRVDMLSRFRTPKEIHGVLADTADGKIDVLIGTHRILSKDLEFKDLGLLIVDEEQRFGVRHKERLKQLSKNVDVLTMTATPIPRTLHMSLLGLRDLSVIETPPKDRLSVQTVVAHSQPDLLKTALEQELGRGGQVYFLHNRVDTIWQRAAQIQELVPAAKIGVGHGQMSEAELEKVMLGFMHHQFDVFVCTTIVENGLDIPLANTIIIENAERYGLSELYQLRGRVGRSNRRAYAYLLVPADTELSEIARKRLAALKEFSDLGAGFKIAALDLELRGAGNLLGGEQHGHINAVGFDMYVRMLEDTVRELKGEEVPVEIHSNINLALDLRIPPEYIADEHQRLRAYKRIAEAGTAEEAAKIRGELEDRYGPPPEAVSHLLDYSLLKTLAQRIGVEHVDRRQGVLNIKFHGESKVDPARLMALVSATRGAQFTPAGVLRLPLDGLDSPARILTALQERLAALAA
ncbi:MAG TPA: transcription-repair coupling factor [Bryobacteraceae bacterium]|nr:transcription-repair coupling factor [Bryobacteraceae bacterium]